MDDDDKLVLVEVDNERHLPSWASKNQLAEFLHFKMKPYHDTLEDVHRGLDYAFSNGEDGRDGFAILAGVDEHIVGAVVFLRTGMQGYIPENLLLFVAVDPEFRNLGIGGKLIKAAIRRCDGNVKLHVEHDNPAKRLYERIGFASKYLEMRYQNK